MLKRRSIDRTVYMNNVRPMKTHDLTNVDDKTKRVMGSHELDEDYNRRITLPSNHQLHGRSEKHRRESQR